MDSVIFKFLRVGHRETEPWRSSGILIGIFIVLDCFTSFAMTGFLLLIAKQPLCGHCFTVFAMTLSYREVEAWRSGYSNYPLYNLQKFSSTCAQSFSSLIPKVSAANFPTILTFAGLLICPRKPCGER